MKTEFEKDEKTARSYDRIANIYDALIAAFEPIFSEYRKNLLRFSRGVILEIGVGTGNSFKDYSTGSRAVAVDASLGMLRCAKQKTLKYNLKTDLLCENVQTMSFGDETFDTIFTSLVFCAVADPLSGLREMRRVLKKNGVLLMLEHVRSKNSVLGFAMDKLNPLFASFDNINRDTVANLRKAGWTVQEDRNLLGDILKTIVATK